MLQTEIDKQHVLQDFVNREVIYCVSSLAGTLAQTEELQVFDEFPELFEGPPSLIDADFECEKCKKRWSFKDKDWDISLKHNDYHIFSDCPECGEYTITDEYEATEYQEIFEHWIVSDYLADKLAERGEAVCKDFYGLTVWGRTCTGQGIALDSVIEDIYDELHKDK